jgi:NADPH:quinone reductase-like Zn-dependent oxidoreductase
MKAAVYSEYGEAEVLSIKTDIAVVPPTASQVVIKVAAAGINPVAWKLRKGYIKAWPQTLPMIPGWDVAGTIVQVGDSVTDLLVGDEVYSYNRPAFDMKEQHPESANEQMEMNGNCCEYVTAESWKVAKKPTSLSMAQAGAVPLAALTAFQGCFDYGALTAGQTLLVLNASGGVGSFAVGFAKNHGITVIGSCSSRSSDYVKSLGADHIIDYTLDASISEQAASIVSTIGKPIDVVFDCIGGDNTAQGVIAVKDGGKVVTIANGGAVTDLCAAKENGSATGIGYLVQPNKEQLTEIAGLIDGGKMPATKVTEMALDDIVAAHQASETGRTHGKIVLIV